MLITSWVGSANRDVVRKEFNALSRDDDAIPKPAGGLETGQREPGADLSEDLSDFQFLREALYDDLDFLPAVAVPEGELSAFSGRGNAGRGLQVLGEEMPLIREHLEVNGSLGAVLDVEEEDLAAGGGERLAHGEASAQPKEHQRDKPYAQAQKNLRNPTIRADHGGPTFLIVGLYHGGGPIVKGIGELLQGLAPTYRPAFGSGTLRVAPAPAPRYTEGEMAFTVEVRGLR